MSKLIKPIAAGVLATGFLLFGRHLISALVSAKTGKKIKWTAPTEVAYIDCNSGNRWYAEFDGPVDAPAIVFIHGINANHRQWYYQREYFRHSHRLIFLTTPTQRADTINRNQSIPALAADLNAVLNVLGISNAIVYGHSMGGTIVLDYCLHYTPNQNVKAIILHGTPYTNPLRLTRLSLLLKPLQQPVIVPLLKFFIKHTGVFNALSKLAYLNGLSQLVFRYIHFSGTQTAAELNYVTAMAPQADTAAIAESVLQLMAYDATGRLDSIKLPTLVIGSRHDRLNKLAAAGYISRHIPGAVLSILPHGHQSMVEDHEILNDILGNFISVVSNSGKLQEVTAK